MKIDFSILNNIFSKVSDIKNNLTSTDTDKPLSAKQGYELNNSKVNISDIQNTLFSSDTNKPLSAKQGNEILLNYYLLEKVPATVTYTDESTEQIKLLTDITDSPNLLKGVVIVEDAFDNYYYEDSGRYFDTFSTMILRDNNLFSFSSSSSSPVLPEFYDIKKSENWTKIFNIGEQDSSYQNHTWTLDLGTPPLPNMGVKKYQKNNLVIFYIYYTEEPQVPEGL